MSTACVAGSDVQPFNITAITGIRKTIDILITTYCLYKKHTTRTGNDIWTFALTRWRIYSSTGLYAKLAESRWKVAEKRRFFADFLSR
jgi:hypothetical protein